MPQYGRGSGAKTPAAFPGPRSGNDFCNPRVGRYKVKGVKTPSGMTDRWARMLVELRDLVYQRVAERRQRETSSLDRAREALSGR